MRKYTAIFSREPDGGYIVRVPALPGCFAQGDSYEEARANIQEVIGLVLDTLAAHRRAIPSDDVTVEQIAVA